jgi:uncharacterized protein
MTLLNKRVLKLNVGFLLAAGPGNIKDMPIDITAPVRIADDLVANTVTGTVRVSRNKEGILAQTDLNVGIDRECTRCLDVFEDVMQIQVQELYAYPHPIDDAEFFIGQDAKLDLAPLLRAEILIALSHKKLCHEECAGLCPQCGTNLNYESCDCEIDDIDPRMAKLKELLDAANDTA